MLILVMRIFVSTLREPEDDTERNGMAKMIRWINSCPDVYDFEREGICLAI